MKRLCIFSGMVILFGLFSFNQASSQWSYNGTHIYNNNSGNVGIGNNAPAKLLYVGKNMTEPTAVIRNFGGSGGATFEMMDDASGADWKFKATTNGGFKIRDNAGGVDVMNFLPSSGRVGIGTASPTQKLEVNAKIKLSGIDDYPFLYFNLTTAFPAGNTGILYDYDGTHKSWIYWLNALNILRLTTESSGNRNDLVITHDGKIGIGTSSPVAGFHVICNNNSFSGLDYSNKYMSYFFHIESPDDGDGQTAIYGYRTEDTENPGTSYSSSASNSAIKGFNNYGDNYTFGTTGFSYFDYIRCGGVLGAHYSGDVWGSLAYCNGGMNYYGGYFTSYTTGTGKSGVEPKIGIGMGAWGDLFGADIHGKVYGAYIEGENYALFSHGDVYKDKLDIHLQKNAGGTNDVLYTNVSADVTVMTSGTTTLSGGKASVSFDPVFASTVSKDEPVVITVTPLGESNGIYLSQVTNTGFSVTENNAGKSNITVNYIAVGKRAGYENPDLSKEVIDPAYAGKLARGLHADADLTTDGEGLYYENGQLVVGKHPAAQKEPERPKEEVVTQEESLMPPGARLDEPYRGAENQK